MLKRSMMVERCSLDIAHFNNVEYLTARKASNRTLSTSVVGAFQKVTNNPNYSGLGKAMHL
jgi:hypothetical protein